MISCLRFTETVKTEENKETVHANNNIAKKYPEDEENNTLKQVCHGDLYIIGKFWISALQLALIGKDFKLIPVVKAAKPQDVPQKPPKMKYTDLPLYRSPHYEYKDYETDKEKCQEANVKLLHRYLLPYVKQYRQKACDNLAQLRCNIKKVCTNTCNEIRRAKNDFKEKMRDPDNLAVRRGVVTAGALTGYIIGGGGRIPRRIFFTTLGLLSTGALCFPQETDEVFRNFAFTAGNIFLTYYNKLCGKNVNLRERLACKSELPPPAPYRKPIKCPAPK